MADENRKLAAIMSADVVGYSKLMADDEATTVKILQDYRAAIAGVVKRHKGRVVNAPGDNILADFPSAVEAVECASEIQQVLKGRNLELPVDRRMEFRIGINLGDVIEEADGTIYGDGVNIAARMEALADTGGICISNTIFDAVEGKLDFGFDFLGAQEVKNIDRPINVYRVRTGPGEPPERGSDKVTATPRHVSAPILAGVMAIVIVLAGVAGWWVIAANEAPHMVTSEGTPPEGPTPATRTGPIVVVLPFDNLSGDSDEDYFAVGISDEIRIALGRFKDLRVASLSGDLAADATAAVEALGAAFVIDGSIRRADKTVRVTVRLENSSAAQIWSESYERELTASNLFEIQDDITNRVLAKITGAAGIILREVESVSRAIPTDDLDAYDCVLRTWIFWDDPSSAEEHAALRDCNEAVVADDSGYADAWANLAALYNFEHLIGHNPLPNPLDRAASAAQTAVALDKLNQEAANALAWTYFNRQELDAFFLEAERAIALNPYQQDIVAGLAWQIAYAGRWERGIGLLEHLVELNPHAMSWIPIPLSINQYRLGNYEAALTEAIKANLPEYWRSWFVRTLALAQLGRIEEAEAALKKMLELYPEFADDPRGECSKWNWSPQLINHMLDGFSKAGLEIPPPPSG
jgi:adenylate cyclase